MSVMKFFRNNAAAYTIGLLTIATGVASCGKGNDPGPGNNGGTGPTGTTGGTTGGTGGTTGTTGGNGGTTGTTNITPMVINTKGGNENFDENGALLGIALGDALNGKEFKTTAAAGTSTTTSLEHAEGAVFDKTLGQWRANFPKYNAADTTTQPYLRTLVKDASGSLTAEYRAYIVGNEAYLYRYEKKLPASMDVKTFVEGFKTANTQKVLSYTK